MPPQNGLNGWESGGWDELKCNCFFLMLLLLFLFYSCGSNNIADSCNRSQKRDRVYSVLTFATSLLVVVYWLLKGNPWFIAQTIIYCYKFSHLPYQPSKGILRTSNRSTSQTREFLLIARAHACPVPSSFHSYVYFFHLKHTDTQIEMYKLTTHPKQTHTHEYNLQICLGCVAAWQKIGDITSEN